MIVSPLKFALAGAVVGVLAACAVPTAVCACQPTPERLTAEGVVRTGDGAPVPGARVHAAMMMPGCVESTVVLSPPDDRALTAADGSYRLEFWAGHYADQLCVRVVAERAAGDTARSDTTHYRVSQAAGRLRTGLDVVFP